MKKVISYIILAAFLLSGCTSQNIMKLNDAIVKANDDLRVAAETFNVKFEKVKDDNYSLLEVDRKKMSDLIGDKLKAISDLKADMPGGEDFKNAFLDYYKFEKDIYDNEFKEICRLTGADDAAKFNEIILKMQDKTKKEDAMESNIHTQQEKFARKNNLKLQ